MRRLLILIALGNAATAASAQEAMPVQTVLMMKEATTFIRTNVDSEVDGPAMSGSGFLVRTEGTTGYIVTNAHVVTPPRGENPFTTRPTTKVYFRSGTKLESRAVAEIVATAPERDLALLKVTNVADLPKPIELASDVEPFETMTVYIFGFPFGQKLAVAKGNPPVNVGRGQVSSLRRNADERVKSVLLDGALNPGNSGGPVVDAKGRLVGIARATIRGANIGFAIAIPELLDMLAGRAEGANLAVKAPPGRAAEVAVAVTVPLLDPLSRVRSARLLYTRGTAKFSQTKRLKRAEEPLVIEDDGDEDSPAHSRRSSAQEILFGPIEGAETLLLSIDQHEARGTLKIPSSGGDLVLWCQVAYVDGAGKTVHLKPIRCFLGAAKAADGEKPSADLTFWGEAIDPDGDCELKMRDGEVIVDVPGTLHDLNIDIDRMNGPRIMQEVEGDFLAMVKVAGSFQPGTVRTGPKSVPYNGGGLLVWLDDGNYIRLERAAMNRNSRVLGLVVFESREQSTKAEGHNKGGTNPIEDLWVRVERKGTKISGALSADGKDWEELQPMVVDWPSRLKVGVDVCNSCGDAMTVRFQNYSLKTVKNPQPDSGH